MELLECNLNNNIGTLLFNKEFTHIKIQIIQDDKDKKSNKKIKELLNDYIEVKFSKPKRQLNVEINKTSNFLIFTIIELDNKSLNKSFKVDIENEDVNINEKEVLTKEIIQSGLSKMLQKSNNKINDSKKQCSIKNENIFAYITRKCINTNQNGN